MINLQVNDQSGPSGPYRMTGQAVLQIADHFTMAKRGDCLVIVEFTDARKTQITREHSFNTAGAYIGTRDFAREEKFNAQQIQD